MRPVSSCKYWPTPCRQLPDRRRQCVRLFPQEDLVTLPVTVLVREQHVAIADRKDVAGRHAVRTRVDADALARGRIEQVQVPVPSGDGKRFVVGEEGEVVPAGITAPGEVVDAADFL